MISLREKSKSGFTIVELLISTTILSVVLVGASFVVVQIGRLYYKGVITSRTQATARNVVDSIARPLQLNGSAFTTGGIVDQNQPNTINNPANREVLCIGNQRFTYAPLMRVQQSANIGPGVIKHGLWSDFIANAGSCQNSIDLSADPPPGGEGLIGENMQLVRLDVTKNNELYTINVVIAYAPDSNDLVFTTVGDVTSAQCRANLTSSQFCAVAEYEATVNER